MNATDKKTDAVKYMLEHREKLCKKLLKMTQYGVTEYFRQKTMEADVKTFGLH